MIRTHKIALVPNKAQEALLRQHVGYARYAWNWALNAHLDERKRDGGKWLNGYDLRPMFNAAKGEIAPWSSGLSQNASKNAVLDLHKALNAWGEYRKKVKNLKPGAKRPRRVGHPKFRKKHGRCQSYQADNGPGTVAVAGKRIALPKIGPVSMREELRFDGPIKKVVVCHDAKRWFAAVSVDVEPPAYTEPEADAAGIDVGLDKLAVIVTSDGEIVRIENPRPLNASLAELRNIDKAIARSKRVHGPKQTSNRRNRLYEKRRRLHARIKNQRADYHHKTTTATAKRCGHLSVETLNVSGMMRNRRLARSLSDAAIAGWLAMLEHKAEFHGRGYQQADRWYPSTKTCSRCQHKADISLSERVYRCSACGYTDDRDINAANNLLAQVGPIRGGDIRPHRQGGKAAPTKRELGTAA